MTFLDLLAKILSLFNNRSLKFLVIAISQEKEGVSLNKLHIFANKSKKVINTHHIWIIQEKFWTKNFGPKGHLWGSQGQYLRRYAVEYFKNCLSLFIWG